MARKGREAKQPLTVRHSVKLLSESVDSVEGRDVQGGLVRCGGGVGGRGDGKWYVQLQVSSLA